MTLLVKPISQISPSTIHFFERCSFQGVLISNHTSPLLPKSPVAVVGTIIHKMMNAAARGDIVNFDDFKSKWDFHIIEEEKKLSTLPNSKHLVPLHRSVRDYSTRKRKCWDSIRPLLKSLSQKSNHQSLDIPENRFEFHVSTREKDVSGYIDAIRETPFGPELIDYKSGNPIDVDNAGVNQVKPDYILQLKLYAALYYYTFKRWPVSPLKIIEIGGHEFEIPYNQNEALKLVQDTKDLITRINCKIQDGEKNLERLKRELSIPSPQACKFCSYRPGCKSYMEKRIHDSREIWPNDIFGKVSRVEKLGNSLFSVQVNHCNRALGIINIRGLSPGRYPVLEVGNNYGFYNLQKEQSRDDYKEGLLTTIYPAEIS
jgi:hypothetical protein